MKHDTIRENIRFLMDQVGLNETQLAKKIGLPQSTVFKLMSGMTGNPGIQTILPIAQYLEVSIDSLLDENFVNKVESGQPIYKAKQQYIPILTIKDAAPLSSLSPKKIDASRSYPILNSQRSEHLVAIEIGRSEFVSPFEKHCVLICDVQPSDKNNTYVLAKHFPSNSLTIRKQVYDIGIKFLLPLDSQNLTAEKLSEDWHILGTVVEKHEHLD